jgi:hypothetical protein
MCTHFTKLAESNNYRHILQCEHGTIHLTWDLVTVYFNLIEFERLVLLLEQGSRLVEPAKIKESYVVLIYKEQGFYQLWWRNIAINLTPVDFLMLLNMSRVALQAVSRKQVAIPMADSANEIAQIFQAGVKISFSKN